MPVHCFHMCCNCSKTNQFRQGNEVIISCLGASTCPVGMVECNMSMAGVNPTSEQFFLGESLRLEWVTDYTQVFGVCCNRILYWSIPIVNHYCSPTGHLCLELTNWRQTSDLLVLEAIQGYKKEFWTQPIQVSPSPPVLVVEKRMHK